MGGVVIPMLVPLGADPVVADRPARLGALGGVDTSTGGSGGAFVEGAVAGRIALGAAVGVDAEASLGSLGLRGAVLRARDGAPLDLGVGATWLAEGFTPERSEVELSVTAARALGATRALLGVTAGREVVEPRGDVEVAVGLLPSLGRGVSLGVQARGRLGVGEREPEAAEEGEGPAADGVVGAVLAARRQAVGGFLFAGPAAVAGPDGVDVAARVSVGVQWVPGA